MGKSALFIFLFLSFAFLSFGQNKEIITVLDFKTSSVSKEEMVVFVDYLISQIVQSGKFTVIDRTQRDNLLKEQEFSVSECTDESCQLSIGKMLAAKYIMVGSIGKFGNMYILNTKFIDVETGETIKTSSEKYPSLDAMLEDSQQIVLALIDSGTKDKPVVKTEKKEAVSSNVAAKETAAPSALTAFNDEFDKPELDSIWSWEKDPGDWSLTKKTGFLSMKTESASNVLVANLTLTTDFQIDTKVQLKPFADGKDAGFRLYLSNRSFLIFALAHKFDGPRIAIYTNLGGKWNQREVNYGQNEASLRIVKRGTKMICLFSKDGKQFTQFFETETQDKSIKAGLQSVANGLASMATYAYFDYFRISQPAN